MKKKLLHYKLYCIHHFVIISLHTWVNLGDGRWENTYYSEGEESLSIKSIGTIANYL